MISSGFGNHCTGICGQIRCCVMYARVSPITDNGYTHFKRVSFVLKVLVNIAEIRASATLFVCYGFYITMS